MSKCVLNISFCSFGNCLTVILQRNLHDGQVPTYHIKSQSKEIRAKARLKDTS